MLALPDLTGHDRRGVRRPGQERLGGARRALRAALPFVVAVVMAAGVLLNGLDGAAGEAVAYLFGALLLGAVLIDRPPDIREWRRIMPVAVPAVLAISWVSLIQIGFRPFEPAITVPLAPDLFMAKMLGLWGGLATLLAGYFMAWNRPYSDKAIGLIVAFLCLVLLFGIVLQAVGTSGIFDFWATGRRGRYAGTAGNINVTAAVAGVVSILAFSQLLQNLPAARAEPKVDMAGGLLALSIALAIGFSMIIVTQSRFALAATSALLVALGGYWVPRRATGKKVPLLPVAVVSAALLVLLWIGSGPIFDRFDELGGDAGIRLMMWRQYWDIAWQSPIYGYGPGSFPTVNAHYLYSPQLKESLAIVNSAHNLPLQLMIVGGMPYLALMTWAGAGWLTRIARSFLRNAFSAADLGLMAAIALMLGFSMVDIVLDMPATIQIMLLLAGMLWRRTST